MFFIGSGVGVGVGVAVGFGVGVAVGSGVGSGVGTAVGSGVTAETGSDAGSFFCSDFVSDTGSGAVTASTCFAVEPQPNKPSINKTANIPAKNFFIPKPLAFIDLAICSGKLKAFGIIEDAT